MTRGQRNHNPLNIRRSRGTRWMGEEKEVTDREFVQFRCDLMGYRAAFRLMRTYINVYHLTTPTDIIHRWAPPEDGNDTSAYIYMACKFASLYPGQHITYNSRDELIRLVAAMARIESNITDPSIDILNEAYLLAK